MNYALIRQFEDDTVLVSKHKSMNALEARYKKIGFFSRQGVFGESYWIVDLINGTKRMIMAHK